MRFLFLWIGLLCTPLARAQEGQGPVFEDVRAHAAEFGVTAADLAELRILDRYPSPGGVEHVYVWQYLDDVPVFNAGASLHFRDGAVVHRTAWLQDDLRGRVTNGVARLTAEAAFRGDYPDPGSRLEEAQLVYFPLPESREIRLAWALTVDERATGKHWLVVIDALTGVAHLRRELSVSCRFAAVGGDAGAAHPNERSAIPSPPAGDGALYHVFPFGVESPLDGGRRLLADPADPVASPYGWHDTNGAAGPEYTTTRGNNAYAYRDADEFGNVPDSGYVADGGVELDFDFDFTAGAAPLDNLAASLTQLFYTTNVLHDWTYAHGFDEPAGNFQANNYGRGGRSGDAVLAEAQDGSGSNNATFYTPRDGKPGRMQMFLWRGRTELFEVRFPADLAGRYPSGDANFGPRVTPEAIAGELVVGLDGSDQPEFGCGPLLNPDLLRGKVVLLQRGDCPFQLKAYRAQEAGAIAVVISNPGNDLFTMAAAGAPNDYPIDIPVIMLREADAAPLRDALFANRPVRVGVGDYSQAPVDGSFDSGVVAHEYGHGVSGRLVGGPSASACLLNEEQMGEGWSDFFLLASTPLSAYADPDGGEKRAVGTYAVSGRSGGRGFRTQYYSTDPAVNDLTYDDVITASVPHGLGEVWAATLWDVYWAMVDAYGFDPDLINGTGGNNRAVRLVIEGMKYTTCSPGLLDGRDGLLTADRLEHRGADACLLWEVFRRRGLGFSADQGESSRRNDNREAFDGNPACAATLKLDKSAKRLSVRPGDSISFVLTLRNDKAETVHDLRIADRLPPGLRFDPASLRGVQGYELADGILHLTLPALAAGESAVIRYRALTDASPRTERLFGDGAEHGFDALRVEAVTGEAGWQQVASGAYSGNRAWFVPNEGSPQEHFLQTAAPVELTGPAPVLRFFTRYDTEPAYDAGIVQIRLAGTEEWQDVGARFLRGGYRGEAAAAAPAAVRNRPSFWGAQPAYQEMIVDLSDLTGQRIDVRWLFASDAASAAGGWWVDQVEILPQLHRYDGLSTVVSAEGDRDSSRVAAPGIVIDFLNDESVPTYTAPLRNPNLSVFPVPADRTLTLRITPRRPGPGRVRIADLSGRVLRELAVSFTPGEQELAVPTAELRAGAYWLTVVETEASTTVPFSVLR